MRRPANASHRLPAFAGCWKKVRGKARPPLPGNPGKSSLSPAVLALLLNRRPAPGPLTLSLVFRGGTVNLPMSRGDNAATFWQAGLGASQLPRMLASQAGVAYLRINGAMQGEISMQNGAAASRSVLGSCHRY